MTYTVLNGKYKEGRLRRIEGGKGSPDTVQDPLDTGYALHPEEDDDPMVYSYMSTDSTGKEEPHILLVRTESMTPADTSYTVLQPVQGASNTWKIYNGREKIKFTLTGVTNPLGNPQSLAQVKVGNKRFIYLVDYDSGRVYGIDVAHFEGVSGTSYALTPELCAVGVTPPSGYTVHGAGIIGLQEGGSHSLFALYTAVDDPWADEPQYLNSTVVKLSVNATTGALTKGNSVTVGQNATGLVPVTWEDTIYLLVPAIGGKQRNGANNGEESKLSVVPTSLSQADTKEALLGAPSSDPLVPEDTFDIRMVAASSDGKQIYVFTGSFNVSYDLYWRLYQLNMSDLLGEYPVYLVEIEDKAVESSAAIGTGYYWSVLYENSAGADGRLWFLKGSPIQITLGTSYPNPVPPATTTNYKYIQIGDPLGGTNVNSVDLTGEMVAQAKTDKYVNALLRAYQPPHVVSGAFRSMADYIRYEKIRQLREERLEREQAEKVDRIAKKQAAAKSRAKK
jgi:hypothetical protein